MKVEFTCPECRHNFRLIWNYGEDLVCPVCRASFPAGTIGPMVPG
ncbi:hypothetical protein [Lucifera butyrica]|nr:hypothetical protein [Lucifera butyrica]